MQVSVSLVDVAGKLQSQAEQAISNAGRQLPGVPVMEMQDDSEDD